MNPKISEDNLQQAREVIESLQLAELHNFFREACLDTKPVQIDLVDRQAAAIYPIILRDRLEIILSIPNEPLQSYSIPVSQAELEQARQADEQAEEDERSQRRNRRRNRDEPEQDS